MMSFDVKNATISIECIGKREKSNEIETSRKDRPIFPRQLQIFNQTSINSIFYFLLHIIYSMTFE